MVTWLGLSGLAQAASALNPADQDSIEQRQKALLKQAQQQQRDDLQNTIDLPTFPLPATDIGDKTCHQVNRIVFQGAEHLSWSVKDKLASSYQGRCLTILRINNLVRETTNAYITRGYVTSQAWLPEQNTWINFRKNTPKSEWKFLATIT